VLSGVAREPFWAQRRREGVDLAQEAAYAEYLEQRERLQNY
jgi:hypothetical protein